MLEILFIICGLILSYIFGIVLSKLIDPLKKEEDKILAIIAFNVTTIALVIALSKALA